MAEKRTATQRARTQLSSNSAPVRQARSTVSRSSNGRASRSTSVRTRSGSGFSSYRGANGRSDTSIRFPQLSKHSAQGSKTTSLIVEWLLAVLLIFWSILDGTKTYKDAMHDALWRLLAVSVLYFVLALMMRGNSTSKIAVTFGIIIDLALILQLGARGTFDALSKAFSSGGTTGGTILMDATETASEGIQTERPNYKTSTVIGA